MEPGHDRAHGYVCGLGYLLVGQPLHFPQGQHRTVLRGQTGEGRPDLGNFFATLGLLAGIIRSERLRNFGYGIVAGIEWKETIKPTATLAQMVESTVGGDGMQPGGESRITPKGAKLLPHRKPHLLTDVPGIGFVPDHGVDESEGALVMRPHNDPKCSFIARLRAAQEVGFDIGIGDCIRHRYLNTEGQRHEEEGKDATHLSLVTKS